MERVPIHILARIAGLCGNVKVDRLIVLGCGSSATLLKLACVSKTFENVARNISSYCLLESKYNFDVITNRRRQKTTSRNTMKEWICMDRQQIISELFLREQCVRSKEIPKKLPLTYAPRRSKSERDRHKIVLGKWRSYKESSEEAVFDPYASRESSHHFKLFIVSYFDVSLELSLLQSQPSPQRNSTRPQRIGGFFRARKRRCTTETNISSSGIWSKVPDQKRASLFESTSHRPRSSLLISSSHITVSSSKALEFAPPADTFIPVSSMGKSHLVHLRAGVENVLCLRLDPRLRDRSQNRDFQIQLTWRRCGVRGAAAAQSINTRRITLPSLDSWTSFSTATNDNE